MIAKIRERLATKIREHFRLGPYAKIRLVPESIIEGLHRTMSVEVDIYKIIPSSILIYLQERPEVATKLTSDEWLPGNRGKRFYGTLDVSSLPKGTYILLVQGDLESTIAIATTQLHVFGQELLSIIE